MKKNLYWMFGLIILLVVFVLFFCKNQLLKYTDSLNPTSVEIEKSEFIIEDMLAQVVHIQSKKTMNYIFESDISEVGVDGFDGITRPGNTKTYESILGDGSGIFVRKDGLLLTNRHVVADPDLRYEVVLLDESVYLVDKIWYHESLDLALIQIKNEDGTQFENNISATFVEDLDTIYIGDRVFAVGTLFGEYQNAVSAGIISKKNVDFVYEGVDYSNLLLSDVLVGPGNSGGPLFNEGGDVMAIVTAQNSLGGTYAIPFSEQNLQDFIALVALN